jgi:hypothetical protein
VVPLPVKYVITSPLSLARVLWWYGEDDMWASALGLAPAVVAGLAPRFAELRSAPELVDVLWSGAPLADAYLVLGAIEHLEGHPRPAVRRQRRAAPLPDVLDRSETERWHDPLLAEVFLVVQDQTGAQSEWSQPWLLPRLGGRYAGG